MRPLLPTPTTYLITAGRAADADSAARFGETLALVRLAVSHGVTLVQLREKHLSARSLYDLASRARAVTRGTATRLVVNDRADVARAAGCDGVHLTAASLEARVVRRAFGEDFLVGVSTHTLEEARAARDGGADFATFGPVYDTPSKRAYGPPVGPEALREAADTLKGFPLVALGGISEETIAEVLKSGASGVAAIRMFADEQRLARSLRLIGGGG
ncbi:MAG TPA: thiamine phosphate synthase [Pyrinomonadaceae bacterium]|nr:thiamine phosphate synthase [Pyrinomonadaceae bacterium]